MRPKCYSGFSRMGYFFLSLALLMAAEPTSAVAESKANVDKAVQDRGLVRSEQGERREIGNKGRTRFLDGHEIVDINKLSFARSPDAYAILHQERRWAIQESEILRQQLLEITGRRVEQPIPVPTLSEDAYRAELIDIDSKVRQNERTQRDMTLEERQRFDAGLELVDLTRRRARLDLQLVEFRSYLKADADYKAQNDKESLIRENHNTVENYLSTIDDAISGMLTSADRDNNFRLIIAGAFAALVGLLICGFFFVTRRDPSVKEAFLSNDRGLQFVTLFSLVIAIILFGIMNVLEGKELSALLGGLSGYILGRSNLGSPSDKKIEDAS